MSDPRRRIATVTLDERSIVRRSVEVEHERAVAIYDLLEENSFTPVELEAQEAGPYRLQLSLADNRLVLDIACTQGRGATRVLLPLAPFRTLIKDYFTVCESYYNAIKHSSPTQIEALDMGRRAIHNEASELLRDRLEGRIGLDLNTARRLFTLVCVLHISARSNPGARHDPA